CQIHPFNVQRRSRHLVAPIVFHITLLSSRGKLALGLSCVEYHIHNQPVQPGRESAFTPELREFFPGSHEHILGQLLALHPAAGHSAGWDLLRSAFGHPSRDPSRQTKPHPAPIRAPQPGQCCPAPLPPASGPPNSRDRAFVTPSATCRKGAGGPPPHPIRLRF